MLALVAVTRMICPVMSRQTIQVTASAAAPLQIVLYTLPLWATSLLLMFFMPLTGFITFVLIAVCLFILPFKARVGACPACATKKMFPFSGFGSACKGCGQELVLRGEKIHLLEEKSKQAITGSGRAPR